MAFTPLASIRAAFATILLILTPQTLAQAPAPAPSGPLNLTAILAKGGQFTTFIRLLSETQQDDQIQNQLNTTTEGFTVFAPTDNAFQNLKSGAINGLTDEEKVQIVQYHITPKFYTLTDLQTVSNPVRTQASGDDGPWGLNVTSLGNQVNISSGLVDTPVNNALRQQSPLAVYQVDTVLLPLELFGVKPPASAPSPKSSKTSSSSESSNTTSTKATGSAPGSSDESSDAHGRNAGLGLFVGLGLIYFKVIF